ncbi:uncharacterized protein BHQ10_004540 [Talaromyces amestolkiae]|uniref:Major facilitator superfamily (MFS) profile domain-containing protein n=1 Tax=Talaromyces amestolkiae TaxID=1196081 RepID=A0A364KY98_TALAM|nr:uncharacterized protein BHQ10_004540 [Talaromyces amestolkiae]RAO68528.1 hypothetical protein BHQ10_004540 [Talaromyces amestolkiae]
MGEKQKKTTSKVGNSAASVDVAPGEQYIGTELTPSNRRRLVRKIDWILMPLMGISYMLQFLDKQALGQSTLMGIIPDLKMTGNQYSWSGSIFYFSYLVFTYPLSMLMVRLPLGMFIALSVLLWGAVLACHAAVSTFAGIMVVRFFLGATEAAVSPGFSLITGIWYTRQEQPLRHGFWFAGNSVATAFGGLVAYGVAQIDGSLPAWKWFFIIYGLITMGWAVVLLLFLPNSISSARFLDSSERRIAEERTQVNQTGTKNSILQWHEFGSLVLAGFGYSTLHVYLLQIPMGAVHGLFVVGRCHNNGARLFGMFIFSAYAAGIPMTLSMISSNVAGFTKKATVSAMMFVAYCIGNIVGPFLFLSREAPAYKSGFISIIICLAVATVLVLVLGLTWRWENHRRNQKYGPPVEVVAIHNEGKTGTISAVAVEDLTDVHNHNFRYVF